jgi:hypothetical protein
VVDEVEDILMVLLEKIEVVVDELLLKLEHFELE